MSPEFCEDMHSRANYMSLEFYEDMRSRADHMSSALCEARGVFWTFMPDTAKCWTRTGFDTDSKVEFGLGFVIRSEGRQSHQAPSLPARRERNRGRYESELVRRRFRRRCRRVRNDDNDDADARGWGTDVEDGARNCGGGTEVVTGKRKNLE
ncbi:hypothetical protein L3X38_038307 [Prunus dulcis]|uniref:Uncharacterized protein n=1 Tax=Prunus dulcis TaxID=3755 RepID=A0AAD4V512_PRUDU|nr:hypothetical protein L3X38_038307 [Prunus dulcis]